MNFSSSDSRSWFVIALVLLIPLCVLFPGLYGFAYPSPQALYSDITVSHYPNAIFLRTSISQLISLPFWSSTILSGYPFIANPLSGFFYPPNWLALILPLPFAFNLLVMLHLFWGGIGMFVYLRRSGMKMIASLIGAMAFEALPKIFAHYGAGHISLIFAISWTPWLLWASIDYFGLSERKGFRNRYFWHIQQPGLIFALILLADVRWGFYAGLLWWSYILFHSRFLREIPPLQKIVWVLFTQSILGILFAAPLLIPFTEYTLLSSRSQMNASDILAFSLPPSRLLGFIYPDFGGFHEWITYPGMIVMALALVGSMMLMSNKIPAFWVCVVIASIIFSMGDYFPGMSFIAMLPFFRIMRIPSRSLFLSGFGMSMLAAYGMQTILNGLSPHGRRRVLMILLVICTFSVVLAGGIWIVSGVPSRVFLWGGLLSIVVTIWIILGVNERIGRDVWSVGCLLILAVDLIIVNVTLFDTRTKSDVTEEKKALADFLTEKPGSFRIYSPSYSLPQHIAVDHELELAYGVDPLHLEKYAAYMEQASGIPRSGYSVTVPSIDGGDTNNANKNFSPNPEMLGLLNVRYVISSFELLVDGLRFESFTEGTWIYENVVLKPRAWIQSNKDQTQQLPNHIEFVSSRPNEIELKVDGPGLLVLSEVNYPGWMVQVDGVLQPMEEAYGLLRGVELTPGRHFVRFYYIPVTFYVGIALLVVGIVVWNFNLKST